MARLVLQLPGHGVKAPIKVLIIAALVLIALPVVVWTGSFLYWQFRIKSVLRPLQRPIPPVAGQAAMGNTAEMHQMLLDAGCRALPYLVRAVEEAENQFIYHELMGRIISCLADQMSDAVERERMLNEWLKRWLAYPPEVGWKGARSDFEKWRRESGDSHHQWWRVWSSNCLGKQ